MYIEVGLTVYEDLEGIGIYDRKLAFYMECGGDEYWLRSQGEVLPTQIMYQWL